MSSLHLRDPLYDLRLPSAPGVAVRAAAPCCRFLYWGEAKAAEAAFGLALPSEPLMTRSADDRSALWLGPGEWLLLGPNAKAGDLFSALKSAAGANGSVTDITHRQTGIAVEGVNAAFALNAACPLDLHQSVFPAGMCARTLYGKAEIVLWRKGGETFHLEIARSLAPYAVDLLEEVLRDVRLVPVGAGLDISRQQVTEI